MGDRPVEFGGTVAGSSRRHRTGFTIAVCGILLSLLSPSPAESSLEWALFHAIYAPIGTYCYSVSVTGIGDIDYEFEHRGTLLGLRASGKHSHADGLLRRDRSIISPPCSSHPALYSSALPRSDGLDVRDVPLRQ
jgi:hypothetical protein